jgi:hypothetical protein
MRNLDDTGCMDDHEWSQGLHANRRQRERQRAIFLEKALRTPRTARRWFRIEDIEPDAHARSNLIDQWRASIWHRDLCLGGKSQVLCLSVSPLAENRFDPDMARGEQFNAVIGDLWMSAPRWLAWFRQDGANRKSPAWLEAIVRSGSENFWQIPKNEPRQKTLRNAWKALKLVFPTWRIPKRLSRQRIAEMATRRMKEVTGSRDAVSRETVERLLRLRK